MNIDWSHLLFALVLLWFPRQWLRLGSRVFAGKRSRRSTAGSSERLPGDKSVSFRTEAGKLRNYIDLLRALAGGIALVGGVEGIDAALQAAPDAPATTAQLVQIAPLVLLLIGVLIQTFRFEGRIRLFPALFYLAGLSFAVAGLYAALFALVLVWAVNLALPSPQAFLAVHGLLIFVFGWLFVGFEWVPMTGAFLLFVPVLLSLLMRRPLVLFSKKVKPSGPVSSA